jgi:hypothetical protein
MLTEQIKQLRASAGIKQIKESMKQKVSSPRMHIESSVGKSQKVFRFHSKSQLSENLAN